MDATEFPALSAARTGLKGRCPRCGKGRLFKGFVATADACNVCGLDYGFIDAGDGPAVFVILIVGFVVCGAALMVEVLYRPSYLVHTALWLPLLLILSLGLMRPLKGWLIASQFVNKAQLGQLDP